MVNSSNIFSAITLISLIFTATTFTDACNTCKPNPPPVKPNPPPSSGDVMCPMNVPKLGMCGDLLSSLLNLVVGDHSSSTGCCTLLDGLDDLGTSVCICEALKANVLGVHIEWALCIKLLAGSCGKTVPPDFQCA